MANVLDIRRRIRSVKNTRQITKAMKMVSAAKLRKAQERALSARPYAQMLINVLKSLVSRADIYGESGEINHPLLLHREEKNILLVVVAGDKGFAGAFNANIFKAASRFIAAQQDKNIDIEAVGRKGRDFFRRRYPTGPTGGNRAAQVQVTGEHLGILGKADFAEASRIADSVIERYIRGEVDAVYVVYNEFKSVIAQRLVVESVLPMNQIGEVKVAQVEELSPEERAHIGEAALTSGVSLRMPETKEVDAHAAEFGAHSVDYIYEQSPRELFHALLPKYVAVQIYRALLESVAAEHAARMTAMDSATSNASDMIDSLTLTMNRVRQAAITKEIIEIVSGAAAL